MCQEIYIEKDEANRPNKECWCPLSEEYDTQDRDKAFLELGKHVWTQYLNKVKDHTNESSIKLEVEIKRW